MILSIAVVILLWTSCKKENNEDEESTECLNPIAVPSFSMDVVPIMQTHCYKCHSNANAEDNGGDWDLEDHSDLFPVAKNGTLLGSIKQEPGFIPMPLNEDKLSACDIAVFENWIALGAMND